ncbi:MAG: hypothetical protein ACFCU6_03865 [Balneolaceae bacterium]
MVRLSSWFIYNRRDPVPDKKHRDRRNDRLRFIHGRRIQLTAVPNFGTTPPARIHLSLAAREKRYFGMEPARCALPQNGVVIPTDPDRL